MTSPRIIHTQQEALALFQEQPLRHIDVSTGGQVAYRRVGQGPDVLFVHGWPVSGATFRRLLPFLSPHVTCHIVDLIGAGHSRFTAGETPLNLDTHISAVREVVDTLKLDDLAVVGHDSGGLIARHALGLDQRVRSMALFNTEQPCGLNWKVRKYLFLGQLPGFSHTLSMLANNRLLRPMPLLLGDCFHDRTLLEGSFDDLFLKPLKTDSNRRWAAGHLLRNFDTTRIQELAELHTKMQIPVKLVWGEDDTYFPVAQAREMVGDFPSASIEVIPHSKLFVHEEWPEQAAQAILPTLLLSREETHTLNKAS